VRDSELRRLERAARLDEKTDVPLVDRLPFQQANYGTMPSYRIASREWRDAELLAPKVPA
jgi:hypothetical protein